MAFLAAGHVPGEGPYGDIIEKGVRFVLTQQKPNGLIGSAGSQEMYEHGISTLMLSEVAGMTEAPLGKQIRDAVKNGVKVILTAQRTGTGDDSGGWRYQVAHVNGSDISVTGWQVMALRAARNIGCDVPSEAIANAIKFIKRCQDNSGGGFRYMPGQNVTTACTGTSILALELCGKNLHKGAEVTRGGNYLLSRVRSGELNNRGGFYFYMVYYCSQATFQLGDGYWNVYREQMHQSLFSFQNTDGSWPDGQGPAYATAMAVLALAVEYRYLPIYQRSEEPADK
jgi:squalene cyclase